MNWEFEISQINLLGALTYRTRQVLQCKGNIPDLYYYPGTMEEIKNAFDKANQGINDFRFPSVLSYQQVTENISDGIRTIDYELAFICNSNEEWSTEQREIKVFGPILDPIYKEFFNQIMTCGYFQVGYFWPNHKKIKVFTTGQKLYNLSEDLFGDTVDFIRVKNLSLTLKQGLCEKDYRKINEEYDKSYL